MADIPGWYKDFVAAVVVALPDELDEPTAIAWLKNPAALEQALKSLASAAAVEAADAGTGVAGAISNDKTADGWVLEEDVTEPTEVSAETIETTDLGEGGDYLFGDEVSERVHTFDRLLGQVHCEYLVAHPDQIPEDYQKFMLVFAGTIWRSPDGNHQVPCATFRQGEWSLIFGILEGGLESRDVLVRSTA